MTLTLSTKVREHIDKWVLRYPKEYKRSGIFEALRVVQEENGGYLTTDLMDAVADYLSLPHVTVYGVATFYSLFNLKPVGKHLVQICSNLSCQLNGAEDIIHHVKNRLQIDFDQTSADNRFTLKEVECLGACIAAPVCQIGRKYYEHLTKEKMDEILTNLP